MTKDFDNFILDNINTDTEAGRYNTFSEGLNIRIKFSDSTPLIAKVQPGSFNKINTIFIGSSLQDYITSWEQFMSLARVLDEAYDYINLHYNKK